MVPASRTTEPPLAFETAVTDRLSPSTSVSLMTRSAGSIVTGMSSVPGAESSTATGASLKQVTSTVTLALSLPPLPSLMS